jgi:hypothetical protein
MTVCLLYKSPSPTPITTHFYPRNIMYIRQFSVNKKRSPLGRRIFFCFISGFRREADKDLRYSGLLRNVKW